MEEEFSKIDSVIAYLRQVGAVLKKDEVREWGTYQLFLSWDGTNFVGLPRLFGWAFDPEHAAALVLIEHINDGVLTPEFDVWCGEERIKHIRDAVENHKIKRIAKGVI